MPVSQNCPEESKLVMSGSLTLSIIAWVCRRFASGHHFRHNYIFLHMFKHANSRQLGTAPPTSSTQFSPQVALAGVDQVFCVLFLHISWPNDLTCNYVPQFVSCLARLVPGVVSRRLFFRAFPFPDVKPGLTIAACLQAFGIPISTYFKHYKRVFTTPFSSFERGGQDY